MLDFWWPKIWKNNKKGDGWKRDGRSWEIFEESHRAKIKSQADEKGKGEELRWNWKQRGYLTAAQPAVWSLNTCIFNCKQHFSSRARIFQLNSFNDRFLLGLDGTYQGLKGLLESLSSCSCHWALGHHHRVYLYTLGLVLNRIKVLGGSTSGVLRTLFMIDGVSTGGHAWQTTWLWSQPVSYHCDVTFLYWCEIFGFYMLSWMWTLPFYPCLLTKHITYPIPFVFLSRGPTRGSLGKVFSLLIRE